MKFILSDYLIFEPCSLIFYQLTLLLKSLCSKLGYVIEGFFILLTSYTFIISSL